MLLRANPSAHIPQLNIDVSRLAIKGDRLFLVLQIVIIKISQLYQTTRLPGPAVAFVELTVAVKVLDPP